VAPKDPPTVELSTLHLLPRGSALLTSSGALARNGIQAVIHAAPGAMTRMGADFDPTVAGLQESVRNSMELARRNGFKRVAIPFIGGGIFRRSLGVDEAQLADILVREVLASRGSLEVRLVAVSPRIQMLFENALHENRGEGSDGRVAVVVGSLTEAGVHNAPVIVNAANMEMQFGGGLSGAIAQATGDGIGIDAEARGLIECYYANPQKI